MGAWEVRGRGEVGVTPKFGVAGSATSAKAKAFPPTTPTNNIINISTILVTRALHFFGMNCQPAYQVDCRTLGDMEFSAFTNAQMARRFGSTHPSNVRPIKHDDYQEHYT